MLHRYKKTTDKEWSDWTVWTDEGDWKNVEKDIEAIITKLPDVTRVAVRWPSGFKNAVWVYEFKREAAE